VTASFGIDARANPSTPTPLVAVIIPALNEAGKIGRVLDSIPSRWAL
jgi:hypothetical protein